LSRHVTRFRPWINTDQVFGTHRYVNGAAGNGRVAMHNLGAMLENGRGMAKNLAEAAIWYERAAALDYPPALNDLGRFYLAGIGAPKNYMRAKASFEQAAQLGDAKAMNNLGLLYLNGTGVQRDVALQDLVRTSSCPRQYGRTDEPQTHERRRSGGRRADRRVARVLHGNVLDAAQVVCEFCLRTLFHDSRWRQARTHQMHWHEPGAGPAMPGVLS
jgi:hypothetical protein